MCFRPPDAGGDENCPNCGKAIHSTNGVYPKKCPFCKTPLDGSAAPTAAAGAPAIPGAPGAPKAPGAPAVPGAPKAPGAPAVPGAPKIPGAPK